MIGRRSFAALLLVASAGASAGCHGKAAGDATDLDGFAVNPFASGARAVVFLFLSTDCPISNRYAPEIRRLAEDLAPRGVDFRLVYPNVEETSAAVRDHARDYGLTLPVLGILRDPHHRLVARANVTVTPSSAVFAAGGALVYHGRIDDREVDFGETRPEPTRHDLEDAVNAVLAGRAPSQAATPAIGCAIAAPN